MISAGHIAANWLRKRRVPAVICSIDGEAEREDDGTVLMAMKIGSELGA